MLDLKVATGPCPCPGTGVRFNVVASTPKLLIVNNATINALIVPAAYLQAECQVLKMLILKTLYEF
jgi:hypothetical protein